MALIQRNSISGSQPIEYLSLAAVYKVVFGIMAILLAIPGVVVTTALCEDALN
jgi:hypothetical protein